MNAINVIENPLHYLVKIKARGLLRRQPNGITSTLSKLFPTGRYQQGQCDSFSSKRPTHKFVVNSFSNLPYACLPTARRINSQPAVMLPH